MSPLDESLIVLAVVLASALAGVAVAVLVPEGHRSDTTRTHFAATVSVVATLAALVLGLAFSNANTARVSMMQDLGEVSSGIVRVDTNLRHFGPAGAAARATLTAFAQQAMNDLFPRDGSAPNTDGEAAASLLDRLETQILALTPHTDEEKWRQSQAQAQTGVIETARWSIAERSRTPFAQPVLVVISFWLAVLYGTYGFFMPRHTTAFVALVLSAMAVAGAILMILEARTPFSGLVRISGASLTAAVNAVAK